MKKRGMLTLGLVCAWGFVFAISSSGEAQSRRRMDRSSPVPPLRVPPPVGILEKMRGPAPYPFYLKSFNDTRTPGELYHALKNVTSPEWKTWYARTHRQTPFHRTSVEFLARESFLVRTPGLMSLVNTTRMSEGVLVISRRPFAFDRAESLERITERLSRTDLSQRYESRLDFLRFLELFLKTSVSWAAGGAAPSSALRIAPFLTLIDIERARVQCQDVLDGVGLAAGGSPTPQCDRAIAESRQTPDPAVPTARTPSRRLIVETAVGPSPITPAGVEDTSASRGERTGFAVGTRQPASWSAPVPADQGAGRD